MKFHGTALLILVVILVILIFAYDYPAIWQLLPQGSHLWRQADSWAMTQNYQEFQSAFLEPATFNLQSSNGKVAGEFPVFYYLAAQFSNAAYALRLMHSIAFLFGIIASYAIAFYFLRRRFLSVLTSILLMSSPLLVFYGNNFLSDVPALSIAFIAWSFFLYGHKNEKLLFLCIAFIFFSIAGLLKASQAINIFICMLYSLLIYKKTTQHRTSFIYTIFFSLISLIIVSSWYIYAKQYNIKNQDTYYFLNIFPVWKLSFYQTGLGFYRMLVSLSNNYFWRPASVIILIAAFYVFRHRKRLDKDIRYLLLLNALATLFYILLFFQKMIGHEYYYTFFFMFLLFLIISIFKTYNFFHAENVFSHTGIFLFMVLNIIYCKNFVSEKLTDNRNNQYYSLPEFHQQMAELDISKDKIILSLPDDSPNKSLSILKRKGYTEFNDYRKVLKNKKADYLILGNTSWKQRKDLIPYLTDSIGHFQDVTFYKLK